MKILYLTDQYKPEYYTGTIKVVENISDYFSKSNDVKIVSYCEKYPDEFNVINDVKYWYEEVDNIECIKFFIKEDESIKYGLYNKKVYEFARDVIRQFNPDIIHIIHPRRVASFMKAAIELNKKYMITCTDTFLMCANLFLFTKSCNICDQRHIEGICTRECRFNDKIIAQNKIMAKEYVDNAYATVVDSEFQIKIFAEYFDKKVKVINHGNKEFEKSIIKKNYPKDKLIFSFNGNSSALKGLTVAIGAFNILEKQENINVELHVYGKCDDAVKLLAGNNVKFFGTYENKDVYKILSTIDVLICPSICYENYPFVITEAFMNKVPVLASNEGGMKAIVKNFVNGFTFTRANPEHLSEIVRSLYLNQEIITKLVENLSDFKAKTVDEEMQEYSKIYEKCLEDETLEVKSDSDVEIMWKNIIENKYKFSNIENYKKIIEYVTDENNYPISIDAKYRFIIRLKNMEKILETEKNKTVFIWGTGMSSLLTIQILKKLYKWINVEFIVDKFKNSGEFQGIEIRNTNFLIEKTFDYLFICTTPGKKEAEMLMDKLNKEANIDYNFGICIE